MGITDHELHTAQAALHQTAKKRQPKGVFFAGPNVKSQDFPLSRLFDANSDHDCLADNTMILPHLQVQGIQPHIGMRRFQLPLAKLAHDLIQVLADA